MYCLFVFTSSCLQEGSRLLCSSLPPVVCRRAHVLFVRLNLQLFVGGLMSCLFVFTSRCLQDGSCLVCSSLPPGVCRRAHVLFVRLYLQLFVGGLMYCLFVFTSSCLQEGSCLVCLSLPQLFVGGLTSCLRWLCLCACGVVLRFVSCVVSFSGLSTF